MSACDSRHSRSSSSSYLALLTTLASDLDHMLSDLCVSQGLDDTHGELTNRLRGQNFLEPYMQGLGINHGDCTVGIESSTIGTSSYSSKETGTKSIYRQAVQIDETDRKSIFVEGRKPTEENGRSDKFPLSNEASRRSGPAKNTKEVMRNTNLKDIRLLANQNKDQLNAILTLTNRNDLTNDLIKRLSASDGASRAGDAFRGPSKQREIVSTGRSGRLIERRKKAADDSSEEDASTDRPPTGDTSDKDESDHGPGRFEIADVNDNTSDGTLSQRDDDDDLGSSDGGDSENSEGDAPCGIGLLERLIRSHPVWYLPGIQRAGAVHLLQGKEEGNFVVRQSSQPNTMAISVRLPAGKGPYIEHYLIQAFEGRLSLESSENAFDSIPSLIAHYSQCCDELPVQLALPRTIREAKNRQQLSSFALLGQEFWRYPMANPRPPEGNNSPSDSQTGSLSSIGSGNNNVTRGSASEIVLDLVPLHAESQPQSLLSTFKGSPTSPEAPPLLTLERERPARPNTLDLICTNTVSVEPPHTKVSPSTDKMSPQGAKTPPPPPPRWTKPSPSSASGHGQASVAAAFATNEAQIQANQQKNFVPESDNERSSTSLNLSSPSSDQSLSLSKSFDHSIASPQSDQTNFKSIMYDKENASLKLFQQERGLPQLVSPVSDQTNLISKSFEKVHKNRSPLSMPTDKFGRSGKRHRRESKSKESRHYRECDILESPTVYYRSNVADKQSDYEDIWGTEPLTTFKPIKSPCSESESWKGGDMKITPDLLEKLEKPSHPTSGEPRGERSRPATCAGPPSAPSTRQPPAFEEEKKEADQKQSSPFYAEPADALVLRRKSKQNAHKARHSDPSSFANWPGAANPYLSGGNILERIDSENELTEEQRSTKTKTSASVDNIANLGGREGDKKGKGVQKTRSAVKAKPVQPPKVGNKVAGRRDQSWTVDSSWEFIGNEENEARESERKFPSIEQQMESESADCRCTVQQMITQRFPEFRISPKLGVGQEGSSKTRDISAGGHDPHLSKPGYGTSASRMSAYDNLTSDRVSGPRSSVEIHGDSNDRICDKRFLDGIGFANQRPEALRWKTQNSSDTLRSKKHCDSGSIADDNEDAQTIFSEPWDSSRWENLLEPSTWEENASESTIRVGGEPVLNSDDDETIPESPKKKRSVSRGKSFKERLDPLLSPPRLQALRSKELTGTGSSIRTYALHLASDKSTTFAQNIDNFIACTLDSKETNPQVVMRNMRQFMSGMKNYLVKHGEREFEKQVERERMKLKSTEFLNLDAILEGVMHKLVVRPLKEHLYKLFVDEYTRNGGIQLLHENINYARTKPLNDLGIKAKIVPPSEQSLETICHFISRLQEVDSPLEKLDHLLTCISAIFHSVRSSNQGKTGVTLGADDFLPLFVWVLVQSGFIAAEIEAEYMWGLLHPSLLSGEGGYYLTTLSSAVHVLKNFKACDLDQNNGLAPTEWNCGELRSVLKIVVPDELHGSILTKTLPVRPNMTTRDVCKIIAHKIRITNPQDYGLFKLVDGEETLLNDADCPQDVKCTTLESGKHCMLAYKRIDAKIAWPRT